MRSISPILLFPLAKLMIHALTAANYGFHRDEYLYLDQGNHLAWGFAEIPPVLPLFSALTNLMGSPLWIVRMIPAIAGALLIYLALRLVRDLGGGNWAIMFVGISLLLSPALLGTNSLFQPVSFNQFCWFVTAYFAVQLVRTQNRKYWLALGAIIGVGFLTKYSILFYVVALIVGVLLTPQRKILWDVYFLYAFGLALLIVLPNLFWQFSHNWPVIRHMSELSEQQLVHMDWKSFLVPQFMFHFSMSIFWIIGLVGLFRIQALKPYRFVGIACLGVVFLIGLLSGKDYYTIGSYYILFVFGSLALEKWMKSKFWKVTLMTVLIASGLPAIPFALPVLPVEQFKTYCAFVRENFGLDSSLRWEDGVVRELPQDIADMHGWEEMVKKVSGFYHQLSPMEKENFHLFAGSYGHAGAINYYRHKYNLPESQSLNSSYRYWAKKVNNIQTQLLITDQLQDSSTWFNNMILVDSITDPNARDPGYIYWRTDPKIDVAKAWNELVEEVK